eukprot:TRINITY_DN121_c0_g1_i2.p1 TRINITY_DN121_c0_g1~~TRINITY_DN121_c0_g1_i2.p1  ORF type:complete len:148 (-),score=18.05 TRINITY_DN121_c0_g1_i2:336-779(-)
MELKIQDREKDHQTPTKTNFKKVTTSTTPLPLSPFPFPILTSPSLSFLFIPVDAGGIAAIVIVAIIVVIAVILIANSLIIVHQAEGMVIERFGKFQRVLNSGMNWITPFVEAPRSFTWLKTEIDGNGVIVDIKYGHIAWFADCSACL